ncbi:hypothetical protein PR048_024003 [Dryococelus australis]|uniref:Uncharacterized protein n=1 Tax=Dryococelus australis TaxID=614101 RepID=A0ABQ9GVN3_9NEOP|nr:hypothetical protein PR048_024003 [Dryococelus australis]
MVLIQTANYSWFMVDHMPSAAYNLKAPRRMSTLLLFTEVLHKHARNYLRVSRMPLQKSKTAVCSYVEQQARSMSVQPKQERRICDPASDRWEGLATQVTLGQGEPGSIPAGPSDFRMWESFRTTPLAGRLSRGSALSFRHGSILTSNTHVGSQDLAVKELIDFPFYAFHGGSCERLITRRVEYEAVPISFPTAVATLPRYAGEIIVSYRSPCVITYASGGFRQPTNGNVFTKSTLPHPLTVSPTVIRTNDDLDQLDGLRIIYPGERTLALELRNVRPRWEPRDFEQCSMLKTAVETGRLILSGFNIESSCRLSTSTVNAGSPVGTRSATRVQKALRIAAIGHLSCVAFSSLSLATADIQKCSLYREQPVGSGSPLPTSIRCSSADIRCSRHILPNIQRPEKFGISVEYFCAGRCQHGIRELVKREIPEKTRRPAASPGTIATCHIGKRNLTRLALVEGDSSSRYATTAPTTRHRLRSMLFKHEVRVAGACLDTPTSRGDCHGRRIAITQSPRVIRFCVPRYRKQEDSEKTQPVTGNVRHASYMLTSADNRARVVLVRDITQQPAFPITLNNKHTSSIINEANTC